MEGEKVQINSDKAVCTGGDATHPKIYLEIPGTGHVACPYCSRVFVRVVSTQG